MKEPKDLISYRLSKAHVFVLGTLEKDSWKATSSIISSLYDKKIISLTGAEKAIEGLISKKLIEEKNGQIRLTANGLNQKTILKDLNYF